MRPYWGIERHGYCFLPSPMEAFPSMARRADQPLEWADIKDCSVRVPQHVIRRDLVSETVLLNVRTGVYYGLDEIGGRFFTQLSQRETVEGAVQALSGEFDAPLERIREDTVLYCSELLARGLIDLEGTDA